MNGLSLLFNDINTIIWIRENLNGNMKRMVSICWSMNKWTLFILFYMKSHLQQKRLIKTYIHNDMGIKKSTIAHTHTYIRYCSSSIWKMANSISWNGLHQTHKSMHCIWYQAKSFMMIFSHTAFVLNWFSSDGWKTIRMKFKRTIIWPFMLAWYFTLRSWL